MYSFDEPEVDLDDFSLAQLDELESSLQRLTLWQSDARYPGYMQVIRMWEMNTTSAVQYRKLPVIPSEMDEDVAVLFFLVDSELAWMRELDQTEDFQALAFNQHCGHRVFTHKVNKAFHPLGSLVRQAHNLEYEKTYYPLGFLSEEDARRHLASYPLTPVRFVINFERADKGYLSIRNQDELHKFWHIGPLGS